MFVSVIVPNYNHSKFLPKRLDSILSQTYQDFELIILDDCSTDSSAEVIESYSNNEKVSHIVINDHNSGSTFVQWQKGFRLAKGELIWIAESDDYCTLDFLQEMVSAFQENNNLAFAYCTSNLVDGDGNLLNRKDTANKIPGRVFDGIHFIKRYMLSGNSVWNASAVVMRKDFALRADKQYMNYKSAGDHIFWIELAEMGEVVHISKKMNFFRQHGNKVTPAKTKDGTTYREEKSIFSYIISKYSISGAHVLRARSSFILRILEGEFLSEAVRKELLQLWNYKKWMKPFILRAIIHVL